jgi:hypothetical protein
MLRMLISSTGWGSSPCHAETAAFDHLLDTHRRLLLDGGRAEVISGEGYSACVTFLAAVEATAKVLELEAASRAYRKKFSANYRALFPGSARHYRTDILDASADQHSAIWVNGDKFELSPHALCDAEALQKCWADLISHLESCTVQGKHPVRAELISLLNDLDNAWAKFEYRYIAELVGIEDKARRLIIQAVDAEGKLGQLEGTRGSLEWREAQASLVQCIAHINSVANFQRKGRDDLGADILESSQTVLERFGISSKEVVAAGKGNAPAQTIISDAISQRAGLSIAVDVVASFEATRQYLQQVRRCIERVDPHLCNNIGLVARLVDWEESWEVGARYVRNAVLQEATCDIVHECHAAAHLAPALGTMCSDCDVELFLVLPRLLVLLCLAEPSEPRCGLLKVLLPHRFPELELRLAEDPEFAALIDQFKQVVDQLGSNPGASGAYPWAVLVRRAVNGDLEPTIQSLEPSLRDRVAALMRVIEKWSLELQRHCAEDWNQCSSVLVQCFNGGSSLGKTLFSAAGKFQV